MSMTNLYKRLAALQLAAKPESDGNKWDIDDTPLSPAEKVTMQSLFAQLKQKYAWKDNGRVSLRNVTDQELYALDVWFHLIKALEYQNEQEAASLREQLKRGIL
jgi:hypothetical protein